MANPQYTAGLHFIVSTPIRTLDEYDRKAIRSHATRAAVTRQRAPQLRSWICPDRELGSLKRTVLENPSAPEPAISVSYPRRVGSDFSGLQLPSGVESYMIQDLVRLIDLDKRGAYPYEVCLDIHLVERGWFPYMISDVCCLHSMMFLVRAFVEGALHNQLSRLARFHYAQTLQHLQARLDASDKTLATSDSTIMVVFFLASVAELTKDFATVATHINGLDKIVNLRGGVKALNTHNNIQFKVCRADLSYALLSGHRPRLLKGFPWTCFIAHRGLINCSHQPHDATVRAFLETTVDTRLHNAFRDLHDFSCISNLAYQTTRKLSPDIYNEMMISILYRLTNLSFEGDPVQEMIRIGLLTFSSTLFIQRHFIEQPYDHLLHLYNNALFGLLGLTDIELPIALLLWFTIFSLVVGCEETPLAGRLRVLLDKALLRVSINSWHLAREILGSIMWVDFIHDRLGKQAFESAMFRLKM
ncbi:hypothetical protein BGW36DRAFT_373329 [Talaromyces proteolyticus]|uniref:Uncharacterized protein n=1 Tax=Talaromyces proteolyticus TaxID=1131652 RepID=A0AAD4Q293_9EURO|nr:uncharacterized protein BGW36DRAFT_373329 [Talaromyces proteolyticus]KAH8700088.1 hypothetical protein BGW36DRAFT_373329 [Talaromyces proteolyticus]